MIEITNELSELILKQNLNILTRSDKKRIKNILYQIFIQEGYIKEAEFIFNIIPTKEERKMLQSIIDKIFPCSQ
jgi:hypothetical protein